MKKKTKKTKDSRYEPANERLEELVHASIPYVCDARRAMNAMSDVPGTCSRVWLACILSERTLWIFQKGVTWWTVAILPEPDATIYPLAECEKVETGGGQWYGTGQMFEGQELYINVAAYPVLEGKRAASPADIGDHVEILDLTPALDARDDVSIWFSNLKLGGQYKHTRRA